MPARVLVACLFVLWLGCKKPESESPASPPPGASGASGASAPAEGGAAGQSSSAEADAAQIAAVLAELTQAVRKYGVEKQKAPKSLEEVAAAGYLSAVPQAPAGKRFAIDKNLQVYLAGK